MRRHTHTHAYTRAFGCTHAVRHVRTHAGELWEHLEELIQCTDKRFLESTKRTIRGASNGPPPLTQTHTLTHTHTPLGCRGKRPDQMSGGNKEHLFALEGIAALMVNSPSTRAGFLPSRCVSSTHPHIYTYTLCHPARITGPPGHRDSQVVRGAFFFFHKTISVCQGQAVWPRTSPHNTQSEAGREDQYTTCVCVW